MSELTGGEVKEVDLGFIGKPYGETNIGRRREENQDALYIGGVAPDGREIGVFVVCDGVGGREKGEVAAQGTVREYARRTRGGRVIDELEVVDISNGLEAGATTLVSAQRTGRNKYFVL